MRTTRRHHRFTDCVVIYFCCYNHLIGDIVKLGKPSISCRNHKVGYKCRYHYTNRTIGSI